MHRYSVDNAVTYTPNDFVLFRESPFALWMERLTLENPDHGIPPDVGSTAPREQTLPQDEIVDTLREEGRDVVLIDWDMQENSRRAATLDAMRQGADFIVNGLLALGSLSANANLLMRTSGYSDLGDYLYIPCDTQAHATEQAAFRLCFIADLLQSLQGQLPPQMLLIRGDADVVPLQTEDHIYYFRAVKSRFMQAMESFRKHRMPDPAESAHFGRWSECASEVLKQRALSAEQRDFEADFEDDLEAGDLAGREGRDEGYAEGHHAESSEDSLPERLGQTLEDSLEEVSLTTELAGSTGKLHATEQPAAEEPATEVDDSAFEFAEEFAEEEVQRVAASGGSRPVNMVAASGAQAGAAQAPGGSNVATLAEQARQLSPDVLKPGAGPGRTPNLAQFPLRKREPREAADSNSDSGAQKSTQPVSSIGAAVQQSAAVGTAQDDRAASSAGTTQLTEEVSAADFFDDALQDLAFIGSSAPASLEAEADTPALHRELSFPGSPVQRMSGVAQGSDDELPGERVETLTAPSPTLRNIAPPAEPQESLRVDPGTVEPGMLEPGTTESATAEPCIEGYEVEMIDLEEVKREASEPHLLAPERAPGEGRYGPSEHSPFVDLDSAPPPTLMPVKLTADERARALAEEGAAERPQSPGSHWQQEAVPPRQLRTRERFDADQQHRGEPPSSFSSSLITNNDFSDDP